jgi:uncharacterized integral membrane protein
MPWRLILFIVIFAIFLGFVTFNLENKSDIYFWFNKTGFHDVPVFMTIFSSFVIGLLCALPVVMFIRKKQKEPYEKDNPFKLKQTEEKEQDKKETPVSSYTSKRFPRRTND